MSLTTWKTYLLVVRLSALLGLCSLLAGCGGGVGMPLSGIVTMDGQPLADAEVMYSYMGELPAGFSGVAVTKTAPDGSYELSGDHSLPAGRYRVAVSRLEVAEGTVVDAAMGMDITQLKMQGKAFEIVPPKYSDPAASELTAEVGANATNTHDFTLSGARKRTR